MEEELIKQIIAARQMVVADEHQIAPPPRTRIERLLDQDSFVEFGALAGRTSKADDPIAADGLVGGIGNIAHAPVVVACYDTNLLHGQQSDRNQRKMAKLLYLSMEHRWPFVCFVDGQGARTDDPLPPPPIAVTPRGRFDLLDGLAELNGWAPTVSIVCGSCHDGHAAIAMLTDLTVAVEDATFQAHGGPDIAAIDYAQAGNVDLLVATESEAIDTARRYLEFYLLNKTETASPASNAAAIADVIPDNRRRPYDMRKVMAAFVDEGSALELAPNWGRSMLTAFARLGGRTIGVYANQPKSPLAGAIDADAADKAARFIELCDAYDFPIVSLIDNPGYMVGPKAEQEGIARHHARPLSALHHRSVPLYSVQLRKAYGLGPYAMSGWGSARRVPELRLAWPSVESGGMSLEGAAYLVKRKEIHAAENSEEALRIRDTYAESMRDANSGLRAARSYQFDDVILPAETRPRIISMLQKLPARELPKAERYGGHKRHSVDLR
ncbi:MAG: hypothetical protein GKR90_13530 [Pseudomonadales bacterium]|nr:hypothetical protein [Pseudomonadales bacterium]